MTILTAKYILDENFRLQKNCAIKIAGSKIAEIAPARKFAQDKILNLKDAVIIPGLINCHNHLELTSIGKKITRTKDFVAWLDEVRETRNNQTEKYLIDSAKKGIASSLNFGVTTIADHSNSGLSLLPLTEMPIRAFILFELIAIDEKTLKIRAPIFRKHIKNTTENKLLKWGLAPHAPYSAGKKLINWAVKKCLEENRILSIHVHEHKEEEEFLKTGTGPFKDMLTRLGMNVSEFAPPGLSSIEYLKKLKFLRRGTLLIHANYISENDMEIIKESDASIIFCPRSHHYFYRKNYPLEKMINSGARVALGTDSMVSNWSLSILDEMRFIKKDFPLIGAEKIFEMATTAGAAALNLQKITGKLKKNMQADIAALGNLPKKKDLKLDDLLKSKIKNIFTMTAGKIVYNKTME